MDDMSALGGLVAVADAGKAPKGDQLAAKRVCLRHYDLPPAQPLEYTHRICRCNSNQQGEIGVIWSMHIGFAILSGIQEAK